MGIIQVLQLPIWNLPFRLRCRSWFLTCFSFLRLIDINTLLTCTWRTNTTNTTTRISSNICGSTCFTTHSAATRSPRPKLVEYTCTSFFHYLTVAWFQILMIPTFISCPTITIVVSQLQNGTTSGFSLSMNFDSTDSESTNIIVFNSNSSTLESTSWTLDCIPITCVRSCFGHRWLHLSTQFCSNVYFYIFKPIPAAIPSVLELNWSHYMCRTTQICWPILIMLLFIDGRIRIRCYTG